MRASKPSPGRERAHAVDDDRRARSRRCRRSSGAAPRARGARSRRRSPRPGRGPATSIAACALSSATPPPGRMPSVRAARVACTASSTRCLRSRSSVSVAPPTLITATPPISLRHPLAELAAVEVGLSPATRARRGAAPIRCVDRLGLAAAADDRRRHAGRRRRASPGRAGASWIVSSVRPRSSVTGSPPVRIGEVLEHPRAPLAEVRGDDRDRGRGRRAACS